MRILIIIAAIFCSCHTMAQTTDQSADIDKRSYEEFMRNDYGALKQTVQKALKNNIDFYYLRLRIGILAYNHKKYEAAIPHFKKALEFYPADTVAQEYLYYAYLLSGRKEAAGNLASKESIAFQQRVGYKKKPFDYIGIDGGAILTKNVSTNRDSYFKASPVNGKAERTLNGNLAFGEFYFQNTFKNRWHLNQSFSVFNTNSLYQVDIILPQERRLYKQKFNNLNFQYNIGASVNTKREWIISAGFGYYRVKGNTFSALAPDTLSPNLNIPFQQDTTTINSFYGALTIAKRFKYVQPYIQLSASNLNGIRQVQGEAGILYYPLGNYYFYGVTSGAYLNNGGDNQFIFGQTIGYKVTNWWWHELNFNYGNLSNYTSANGFLTYNTSDVIKLQAGLDFRFYIKKHLQLNVGYTFQQRERTASQFEGPISAVFLVTEKSNYITHLIKTNLLWNF